MARGDQSQWLRRESRGWILVVGLEEKEKSVLQRDWATHSERR